MDISIEPFRGDLEGLEKMAHSSWRDEYGISSFPNLYRPVFLRYLIGRVGGIINFIYHDHLGQAKERWAWINHVNYVGLSGREKISFINAFLCYVKEKDCIGIIEWTKKYYPQGPFYRAHFFPYFRAVNMYSWTFNPAISLKKVKQSNEILV